jgi:hypothetical protein
MTQARGLQQPEWRSPLFFVYFPGGRDIVGNIHNEVNVVRAEGVVESLHRSAQRPDHLLDCRTPAGAAIHS